MLLPYFSRILLHLFRANESLLKIVQKCEGVVDSVSTLLPPVPSLGRRSVHKNLLRRDNNPKRGGRTFYLIASLYLIARLSYNCLHSIISLEYTLAFLFAWYREAVLRLKEISSLLYISLFIVRGTLTLR